MESLFQNCVSEFDLNFLDQTTNVNQATQSVQCPVSRKLGIARMKDRLKGISQVVHKAKHTNQLLLENQQELLGTKQELEETRNLLFEKNEEYKVICDERSMYFNQATEYSNEIQKLKEQLKKFKEHDYESKLKDKIIQGYIEQVTGLKTEMINLTGDKKQSEKETSIGLIQANKEKGIIEKKLVKLLSNYVLPTIKKRDRWLQSLMKKYLPNIKCDSNNHDLYEKTENSEETFENVTISPKHKEEESQKIEKPSAETVIIDHARLNETVLDDVESPTNNSMQHRNISLEFECVGSVDTGRGSSLAFSDGEKSFHSPDYYMNDSPSCTVANLCNKCNILKSDICTSPIPLETSDIANRFATNSFSTKRDACTSPMPLKKHDVATETADVLCERDTPRKKSGASSSPTKQCNVNSMIYQSNISQTSTEIRSNEPVKKADGEKTAFNHKIISSEESPTVPVKLQDDLASSTFGNLIAVSRVDFNDAATTPVKLSDNVISDNDEALNEISRTSSPVDDLTMISDFDVVSTDLTNISSKELPTTLTEINYGTPDTKLSFNQKMLKEKECLKLNSSDNVSSVVGTDREIQLILDKMRLHPLVTPIPKTPPHITMQSPNLTFDNQAAIPESSILHPKLIAEGITEDLNLIRAKVREAFSPFVGRLPMYIQQIMLSLTGNEMNEKLLRNILSHPNSKNNHAVHKDERELLSHIIPTEASNKIQTQAVNLNTASLSTTKMKNNDVVNDNKGSTSDDDAKMQLYLDSENLKQLKNRKSRSDGKEEMCKIREELPHTEKSKITIVPEVENSCSVPYLNDQGVNNKNSNNSNNGYISNENTQKSILNNDMNVDSNTSESSVIYLDTESMLSINTRNNIVYESEDNASDDDADIQKNLGLRDVEQIRTRTNKDNENEEMCQNKSNNTSCSKKRKIKKLTKLEKIRFKMVPKAKIRNEPKQPVKKLRFKPTPIIIPQSVPKKKVTESDTAASLNDKSIYENAVKIIAALKPRSKREPKIIVEDCVLKMQKSSPNNARNESIDEDNISNEPQLTKETSNKIYNHKRKLVFQLGNVSDVPTKLSGVSLGSNESAGFSDTKKRKRSTICSDDDVSDDAVNLKQLQCKLNSSDNVKSETVACQRHSSLSLNKSASETFCTKRTNEVVCTLESNESISNNQTKRIRTSVSDCLSPHKKSNNNSNIVESIGTDIRNSDRKDSGCETIITKSYSTSTRQRTSIETGHTVPCSIIAENTEIMHKSPVTNSNQTVLEYSTYASIPSQRILRSSNVKHNKENGPEKTPDVHITNTNNSSKKLQTKDQMQLELSESVSQKNHDKIITYADLSMFSNEQDFEQEQKTPEDENVGYKDNLLCRMIEKHGVRKIKFCTKKVPDSKVNKICSKLETSISQIVELPHDHCLGAMKSLVIDIRSWDVKLFLVGLMKYLKNPQRKIELFKKLSCPPAPPMTSKEQVLLYVIDELQNSCEYRKIVKQILINIEYILFALNKTPEEIDVIESMSHFYALLCRSYQTISKMRLFIIDAMYCLQYKSILVVKQCLDVWMFALPLGHMGLAKTPLVSCLVYLLHFYKCEDKFNRIQEMRNILRRKYNYDLADWNETKILELFRNAITEIRDIPTEKKMLRLALIILAKRNGPTWCQNHIVKKMLQPMIKNKSTSEVAKQFCVSLLGPLMKPYPNNMKVHCEMTTDYLLDMLGKQNSPKMQEAIITSLLCTNKQNNRVIQFLVKWNPKRVSPEFESVFKDYVKSKPVKKWKTILSSSLT